MSAILAPSGMLARRELSIARARYEAGMGGSKARSNPPVAATHIYRENTPAVRRRLVDDSRDLCDNSPFLSGLIERMVTYVIGCGIYPLSASEDKEWNDACDAQFAIDVENVDFAGLLNWPMLQAQLYRSEKRDGDSGGILGIGDDGSPKVFPVEGHSIGVPFRHAATDEFDGIILGSRGRPERYRVCIENPLGVVTCETVDAPWFAHFYEPARPGQLRGTPLLSPALATGRDIHDILALEKAAVKDASSKQDVIKTASGEINTEDLIRTGGLTPDGSDGEDAARYYREKVGTETIVLRHGDEHTPYEPKRPGPAWQGFMDFLAQTVCLAAKIPPSVLLQIKVGGADTRRDLAAAARVFEMEQLRIARQSLKIRNFFVEARIKDGTLDGAPDDWRAVAWQLPKTITVDAGREAQQDREDLRFGSMSEQEYHGRYGNNWRHHRDQVELETRDRIQRAKRVAKDEGITFEMALSLLGDRDPVPVLTAAPPQQTESTP